MSQSKTESPAVVAAEGMACNAPNSDRVPPPSLDGNEPADPTLKGTEYDEVDFLEQLSRLNSDFEDGLDVVRELESQCVEETRLSPTFATLAACAVQKMASGFLARARRHPVGTAIGVSVFAAAFGIALSRRMMNTNPEPAPGN